MAYAYKMAITIDHTKVPSTDQTNFPVLVSTTNTLWKTAANGGHFQTGVDFIFKDSTETTILNYETESYTATTGAIIAWVNIPTLSHTADTVIYIYYGDATVNTSQENVSATWNTGFSAVYHLKESAGTSGSIKDSTSNANVGTPYTNYGTSTIGDISTTSGEIGNAQSFNGTNHAITAANSASLDIGATNVITLSAWVKRSATNTTGSIIVHGVGGSGGYCMEVGVTPATVNQIKCTKFGVVDITLGTLPADTNWHLVHEVGDGSGTYVYVDGAISGTSGNSQNWKSATALLDIGGSLSTADNAAPYWNGTIDEVRISNVTRSANWITTEYNSQSSPATFYSVGSEQNIGVTTNTRTIPSTVALLVTGTRTIPGTVALLVTSTRTIPSTVALEQTSTRTIPGTVALLQTSVRTVPGTVALLVTGTRVIPGTVALEQTSTRTVPSTVALLTTNTRTIPGTVALLQTGTRTVPCTVSLSNTTRIIPCTVALEQTSTRTIPCTVSLSVVTAIVPNAIFYVRSGNATFKVRL